VSIPAAAAAAVPTSHGAAGADPLQNRFLVSSVAFLRAKQLLSGARPRLPANGHKPPQVAVLEVLADAVSWSVGPEVPPPFSGPAQP
jgi:DNA-directed RNA polymerase subunit K/omega